MNDGQPHTVVVRRTERDLEILLDDQFFNRTIIPPGGREDSLLEISTQHVFLGARVGVGSGEVVQGFTGCITGATLDRRELPFDASGNDHFDVVQFPPGSAVDVCPLGAFEEAPRSDVYVFSGLGAIIAFLFVISFIFVLTCAIHDSLKRSRQGQHNVRRSNSSPSHGGFTWQSAYNASPDERKSPTNETFTLSHLGERKQADESDGGGVAETGLAVQLNTRQGEVRSPPAFNRPGSTQGSSRGVQSNRQGSGRSRGSGRLLAVPPPSEGFTAVSQSNPGFLQESPASSDHELLQEEGRNRFVRHMQSLSRQQSNVTDSAAVYIPTELLSMDDAEVTRFIRKKVVVADENNEDFDVDKMEQFAEEGEFEPLGSIGSLYDFVRELDTTTTTTSSPVAPQLDTATLPAGAEASSTVSGQARGPQEPSGHPHPLSGSLHPSMPARRSGRGKRPKPIMIHSPPSTAAPPPPQVPHPPSMANGPDTSPIRSPATVTLSPPGYETKPREKSTEPLLSPDSPESKLPAPLTQNGHWVPISKHSASQPENSDLGLRENGGASGGGSGHKGAGKLRRSGRRAHRVGSAGTTSQNKDMNNILEKFHHMTANPNHFASGRAREESNIL